MLHDLLKAISNKDYLSAKGFLEGALQEKIAGAIDDKRFEVVDKMFNPQPAAEVKEDTITEVEEGAEEITEEKQKHVVLMTLSDPQHTMVSKRKEQIQRRATVTAADRESAINTAHAFYKKQGYKVHDHHYVGLKEEVESLDEISKDTAKSYVDKKMNKIYSGGHAKTPEKAKKDLASLQRAHERIVGNVKTSEGLPFTPDKPHAKSAVAGKFGLGYSTARHLARQGMKEVQKEEVEQIEEGVSIESKARYEYANGKSPKGSGQWMFSTVHPKDHDVVKHKEQTHTVSGNFSDAAKAAAKHFKGLGHKGEIHVLS